MNGKTCWRISSRASWIWPASSLLAASNLLNRSGVWFMQDKETGSEGSWHSLMDDAQKSLTVYSAGMEGLAGAEPTKR